MAGGERRCGRKADERMRYDNDWYGAGSRPSGGLPWWVWLLCAAMFMFSVGACSAMYGKADECHGMVTKGPASYHVYCPDGQGGLQSYDQWKARQQ